MKHSPDHHRADPYLWSCSACLGVQWQASKWALGSLAEASASLPSQFCNKWHTDMSRSKTNHMTIIKKKAVFNPGNFIRILFLVNCIYNIFYTVWNIKTLPDFFLSINYIKFKLPHCFQILFQFSTHFTSLPSSIPYQVIKDIGHFTDRKFWLSLWDFSQ